MNKKAAMKVLVPAFLALLFAGCQPEPDNLKLLDDLVVETNYDTSVNFSNYHTYTLALDTIGFISNRYSDTILVTPKNQTLPRTITNQIQSNLTQRGMTRVSKSEEPDLGVIVFIVNDIDVFQQVVYPGYYYPSNYYNYYSYYAYPYVQTSVTNTGALIIELVDLKNKTADNKVKVVWSAYMADIVSTLDRELQAKDGIDQAFIQSSYIGNLE
jgi:hypothetical protein